MLGPWATDVKSVWLTAAISTNSTLPAASTCSLENHLCATPNDRTTCTKPETWETTNLSDSLVLVYKITHEKRINTTWPYLFILIRHVNFSFMAGHLDQCSKKSVPLICVLHQSRLYLVRNYDTTWHDVNWSEVHIIRFASVVWPAHKRNSFISAIAVPFQVSTCLKWVSSVLVYT